MNDVFQDSMARQAAPAKGHLLEYISHWELNNWTIIALSELVLLIILLILLNNRTPKKTTVSETIDFDNIVNSAFHSSDLYNRLKVKCHPDRFANDIKKQTIALELFQLINKNRNNIKALEELKLDAESKLDITI